MEQIKTRPIIFSSEMVRAILDGSKTQTRRVIKPQPTEGGLEPRVFSHDCPDLVSWQDPLLLLDEHSDDGGPCQRVCPFGSVGGGLWVKETFQLLVDRIIYKADYTTQLNDVLGVGIGFKWRSALFMPRHASRLLLEITDVRVERLHWIANNLKNLGAEGIPRLYRQDNTLDWTEMASRFRLLWDSLHKKEYQWHTNPWVWSISFRQVAVSNPTAPVR